MTLADLCFNLRKRRRMYLLDDRFSTAVAFVEGWNAALDGVPLDGYPEFVAERTVGRTSSLHWAYLIASGKLPAVPAGELGIDQIPAEFDDDLTNTMLDLLDDFRSRRDG